MAADGRSKRAPQIPRARAKELFIEAVIDLLETLPIAEIPDQLIADTAGINRATIYRHFGSRFGLLDAVVAELTLRWLEIASELVPTVGSERADDVEFPLLRLSPLGQKIFQVAAYLIAGNHDSETFQDSIEKMNSMWIEILERLGVSPRMARALAFKTMALNLARASSGRIFGVSDDDVADMQALALIEISNHEVSAAKLGWAADDH